MDTQRNRTQLLGDGTGADGLLKLHKPITGQDFRDAFASVFLKDESDDRFSPLSHSHAQSDVTGLVVALAAKYPAATAVVLKQDGSRVAYNASANTDAARGTAVMAAATASVSGDTIVVGNGNHTITANLAKNGVNWFFSSGATLTWTGGTGYLFDDNNTAMTFTVGGYGKFVRIIDRYDVTQNFTSGIVFMQHASSKINFYFDEAYLGVSGTDDGDDFYAVAVVAFGQKAGNLYLNGRKAYVSKSDGTSLTGNFNGQTKWAVLWWENGEFNASIDLLGVESTGLDTSATVYTIWAAVTATPTGDMRVNSQHIAGHQTLYTVGHESTNASAALWISSLTMHGRFQLTGGKTYVALQKLIGRVYIPGGAAASTKLWMTADKIGGNVDHTGHYSHLELRGPATTWINVKQFEADSTDTVSTITVTNGTHRIASMDVAGVSGVPVIDISGGTLDLYDATISPAAGQVPISQTGGTLRVHPQVDSLSSLTDGDVLKYDATNLRWHNVALGTLSTQNANNVSITGGTISGLTNFSAAGSLTGSSGTVNLFSIAPTSAQTGSAGYTVLNVDVTDATSTFGTKKLIDAKFNGASKFSVDRAGAGTFASNVTTSGYYVANGTLYLRSGILAPPELAANFIIDANADTFPGANGNGLLFKGGLAVDGDGGVGGTGGDIKLTAGNGGADDSENGGGNGGNVIITAGTGGADNGGGAGAAGYIQLDAASVVLTGSLSVANVSNSSGDLTLSADGTIYLANGNATVDFSGCSLENFGLLSGTSATFSQPVTLNSELVAVPMGANPTAPANDAQANIYVKGNKLVIQYTHSGTTRYFTIDLTSAASQSVASSTSAP